jgi:rSAM/selenodomain-associated transferase 2
MTGLAEQNPDLDIVIPTLDAAAIVGDVLAAFSETRMSVRRTLVDGGSTDGTPEVAKAHARVLAARKGRGPQLAAGGAAATAPWILFWHADTLPVAGWEEAAADFMRNAPAGSAGYFRFRLDDTQPAARRLERLVTWRCRFLGLPYGDQGLLIRRDDYLALGGYRPLPIMEDVDLVRRIGRGNLHALDAEAITSAARYRRDGYVRRPLRNLTCLALHFAGLPAARIAALYR